MRAREYLGNDRRLSRRRTRAPASRERLLFAEANPEGRFKHRVDTVEAMQSMARSGLGITVLPCYVGDRDEGLRRLEPKRLLDCGLDLWVLHHPDIRSV